MKILLPKIAFLTLLIVTPLACVGTEDSQSSLRAADAFKYTGSIHVSLADLTAANKDDYRLAFAAGLKVNSLGVCPLRTITDAASCKAGVTGYIDTESTSETATKRFFKAKDGVKIQDNLILALQGFDSAGAVVDTRVIRFTAGTTASAAATGAAAAGKDFETKGSGGKTGAYDGTYGTSGQFKMIAATDNSATKSHGLLIFLHGSTASSYADFAEANAPAAAQNGLMSVSVLAPNGQGWNEGDQTQNAQALDELIEETLFKQYNIDKRKIFFHGQSSGSGFLSSHFVPLYGKNFGGGAMMLCGAKEPEPKIDVTDAEKKSFRLYYDLTVDDKTWTDFLVPSIEAYRKAGLTVESTSEGKNQKPGGHCQFDQQAIISEKIPEIMKANGL